MSRDRAHTCRFGEWTRTSCDPGCGIASGHATRHALADVIRYPAGVAGLADAVGASLDVGGQEVITYREIIARIRGRRPLIAEVPMLSP